MNKLPLMCFGLLALFLNASTGRQITNSPPVVKLTEPVNNTTYDPDMMVRYAISVSDKEDGESRFDEIPSDKIFLEIRFFSSPPATRDDGKFRLSVDESGLKRLKKSDCFTCHQFKTQLIGPSFMAIAKRYANNTNAEAILAHSIQGGSQDGWGEAIMPAHPEITEHEAGEIAAWILKAGIDENLNYVVGKDGAFRLTLPSNVRTGFFLLKATYTDSGLPGQPDRSLAGYDAVLIRAQ